MPLPLGHSLAGYSIYCMLSKERGAKSWQTALLLITAANLPDIDFLPGFLLGNPNALHQTYTHTPAAALLVGLFGAAICGRKGGRFLQSFTMISLAYLSHILLDYFNQDLRPPAGVMLFWPFSDTYYTSPWSFFVPIHKSSDSSTFFYSLWHVRNLQALVRELLVLGPVAGLCAYVAWQRSKAGSADPSSSGQVATQPLEP